MSSNDASLHSPSISRRVSLRFLPNDPEELTCTVVLNGGGATNLYTDFRPFLEDPSDCEWAFAGVKSYLEDGRCSWGRIVDNRSGGEDAPPDIGRCETLPNGDELETGEMLNPETGRVEKYEEVWRDDKLPSGTRVVVLQLRKGEEVRGVFIQVGNWAQGVVRGETGVTARRWRHDSAWECLASYGNEKQWLPALDGKSDLNSMKYAGPARDGWQWDAAEDYVSN